MRYHCQLSVFLFVTGNSKQCKVVMAISLIVSDFEPLFMYLLSMCISSFEKCLTLVIVVLLLSCTVS